MPNYKGHLVGGGITYLLLLQLFKTTLLSPYFIFPTFLFCLLGSLFPDVDIKSKGQKIFYILILCLLLYFTIYGKQELFVTTSFVALAPLLVKHRGIFHSMLFLLGLMVLILLIIEQYVVNSAMLKMVLLFFFAGAFSHIILDRLFTRLKRMGK